LPVLEAAIGESLGDGGGVSPYCCRRASSRYSAIVAGSSQEEILAGNTGWMKAGDAGAVTKIAVRTDQMSCLEHPDAKFDLMFARRAGTVFAELGETVDANSGTGQVVALCFVFVTVFGIGIRYRTLYPLV
jgi:hypothetical protein